MESDEDLYKIINWYKLGPAIKTPSLVIDGKSIDDPTEHMRLGKRSSTDIQIQMSYHTTPLTYTLRQTITSSDRPISQKKMKASMISIKNTFPGMDGMTVRLLKICRKFRVGKF